MTHKTRPIQLPIDPAKAHLYVARNGVGCSGIINSYSTTSYQYEVSYEDGWHTSVTSKGIVSIGRETEYDLTTEIIPEAPERDWDGVIGRLAESVLNSMNLDYVKNLSFNGVQFKKDSLAILKEFDAQNQPDVSNELSELEDAQLSYQGAMAEIDMIVEEMARCYKNGYSWSIKQFFEKNYPKQWEKYMKNPNENLEPEKLELVVGEMYDITTGKAMIYPTSGNYLFTDPVKYCTVYDFAKDRIIGKHTPAPAVHEVEFLIDVYRNKDGAIIVLPVSIKGNGELIASGLHFKRTFTEGEGLDRR